MMYIYIYIIYYGMIGRYRYTFTDAYIRACMHAHIL